MLSIQNKIQSLILSKCVDPGNRMIGVEEESILYSNNGLRLPIKSSTAPNAKTITEILNKKKGLNGLYTMEPGGQVEWSSPPFRNLNELSSSMQNHNKLFESVVSKMQSKIIYFGLDPQFDPDSVELIDDQKYKIMDQNSQSNLTDKKLDEYSSNKVSLETELSETLYNTMKDFVLSNPTWDQYKLINSALATFLVQNGCNDNSVSEIYLNQLFTPSKSF